MRCERCGTIFCWDDADECTLRGQRKRFCGKECRRKDRKGAGSRRVHAGPEHQEYWKKQACKVQAKYGYASKEDALRRIAELGRIPPLYTYPCPCGFWHLTTQKSPESASDIAAAVVGRTKGRQR